MILTASGTVCISIHALRVEGDMMKNEQKKEQSFISIHALRVEGDDFSR